MRDGWSDKQIAIALGVAEHKASQCYMPALVKIARLFALDPIRTMRDIVWASESLRPIDDGRIDLLERMLEGRVNRVELGQTCPSPRPATLADRHPPRPSHVQETSRGR